MLLGSQELQGWWWSELCVCSRAPRLLETREACLDAAQEDGYAVKGLDWSPIRGADGNIEFLCHLKKSEAAEKTPDSVIAAVVEAAHGGQP